MSSRLGTGSGRRRRTTARLATTCTLGLLAAGLADAPAADAADAEGVVAVFNGVRGDADSTGERCDTTGDAFGTSADLTTDGTTTATRDVQQRTITAPDDTDDTTSFTTSATARGSVRQVSGSVRSFDFVGVSSVISTSALGAGSDCDYDASATSQMSFSGDFQRGFLRITLRQKGTGLGLATIADPDDGTSLLAASQPGLVTFDVFLEPGEHQLNLNAEASVQRPVDASSRTRSATTVTMGGDFARVGGAITSADGAGRSTVKLPGARSCSSRTLTAKLKRKARQARQVVLQVDGRRPTTVRKPRAGTTAIVRRIPATASVTAVATITRKNGKVLTTTRDYVPCTA